MKKIVIIGAGVVGITTAYYLQKKGYEVEIFERNENCAMECSFANGGQLSYSHIEPWATPNLFRNLPRWLVQSDSPLKIHNYFDYKALSWIAGFLFSCSKSKSVNTAKKIAYLSSFSRKLMHELIKNENIDFKFSDNGTLHVFSSKKGLQQNIVLSNLQKQLGFNYKILNSYQECLDIEPSLIHSKRKIVGGIYFPQDESGDINLFCRKLSDLLKNKGVKFHYKTNIDKIDKGQSHITRLIANNEDIKADGYVIASGASSSLLLNQLGIKNKIHPLKGYSITISGQSNDILPKVNITDQSNKIVYSRIGDNLRVAGMVDFAGFNSRIFDNRVDTLLSKAEELFPQIVNSDHINISKWSCLRSSTYDCRPIIGKTKYENLFINTGHGSLGWTLSLASAKELSAIV